MGNISFNFSPELILIFGFNLLLIIILFLAVISANKKYKRLNSKYNKFMNGLSDRNIEALLETNIGKVNNVESRNREIENHINQIERYLMQCTQKVGIVRFSAFENVGSNLSFAIALIDANDNGIVMSSIYSRDSSSIYAKPVVSGKSKYPLSAEEIQALDLAKYKY